MLSAEELLAGGSLTFEVEVPAGLLAPGNGVGSTEPARSGGAGLAGAVAGNGSEAAPGTVRLRPLTVADLQLVSRAAKENDSLLATLMVQRALVEPELSVAEVAAMHVGLVEFLLGEVNRISGINATRGDLTAIADAPLAKATFVLAERFGWTPQEVSDMTLGQILLHLQMLGERPRS
jgi:hypothetical protein